MPYTDKGRHIEKAAKALADLNIFAAVMVIMEGSIVSSDSDGAAAKIIRICKAQQQVCLARYDAAMKAAGGGTYGK
jgi:hypothetical protein